MHRTTNTIPEAPLLFLVAALLGCASDPAVPPSTSPEPLSPGAFALSWLQGFSKPDRATGVAQGVESQTGRFELGDIRGSCPFYFLLFNTGLMPIRNISFSSTDSAFEVSPQHIDSLLPNASAPLLPIVKVAAIHGSAVNGYGYRPLMPKGLNTAVITVSGTTLSWRSQDTTVTLSVELQVNALVMDAVLRTPSGDIDMSAVECGMVGSAVLDSFMVENMRGHSMPSRADTVLTLVNTGNVDIALRVFHYSTFDGSIPDTFDGVAAVSESLQVPVPPLPLEPWVVLDGRNTVADHARLSLSENGKCYFMLCE